MTDSIYTPPKSELEERQKGTTKKLRIIALLAVLIYLIPKLPLYTIRWIDTLVAVRTGHAQLSDLLTFSTTLPLYFCAILLAFGIKLGPTLFWRIYVIAALADEVWYSIMSPPSIEIFFLVYPIYIIAAIYAFKGHEALRKEVEAGD